MSTENYKNEKLPKIAIIGRPNVGKSTLFNRLARYKHTIVFPTPGVTRDRINRTVTYDDFTFILMDTGGITIEDDDDFKSQIRKQCDIAFKEADLILFLVDIDGITTDEEYIVEKLRKIQKPIVLAVNKIDNEDRLKFVSEYYELGFGEPIPISAEHGRNIYELIDAIREKLSDFEGVNEENIQNDEDTIKISIIGKPNSGKSSLLNKILGYERSIVTDVPGTTRDSIEESMTFENKKLVFVDTAGIRRKSKVETKGIEYASVQRSIDSIKKSEVVLLLIDSIENISQQDKKIASIAASNYKPLILVVNKWDLIEDQSNKKYKEYEEWIRFKFSVANYVPIINISAVTGLGINKLLKLILSIQEEYHKRIETSTINKWISVVTDNYLPSGKRGSLKIFYGTQVSSAPPSFLFFVNKKEIITDSYERYLSNNLREAFGFSGIPLKISFKERNQQ